ncbi:hypothetical protein [Paenibacillus crassostreae]|uniref:Helicase XPB/Ssl2 N-terminal domain-containing protein n=1 Tax=Paenibacillus crassostreae TaxID=1763538 RepID=A0A167C7K2_9BACL|nr:hypothetical protein [Paenibacillus crassostreae]AOZ91546.1 hypothetical protein LPB68_04505 [Paenibacillus crassostreae]OAB72879.1 hypothetical protein PNBC_15745 [Paenibacillus crassostreae]
MKEVDVSNVTSEQSLLKIIYMNFASQLFDDTQFMKLRMLGYSGAEHLLLFLSLRKKGRIRTVMKSWGERRYYIPIEQLPRIHQALFNYIPPKVGAEIQIIKAAKPGIVLDLFNALVFIAQDQLLLNSKGIIHKKSVQRLNKKLQLKEEDLGQHVLQLRDNEGEPRHITFVLELLDRLNLVHRENKRIVVHEEILSIWLTMNTEQMTSILVVLISERVGLSDTERQHLFGLLSQPEVLSGQWIGMKHLIDYFTEQQLLNRTRIDQITTIASAWITALAGLGWMDVGESDDDHQPYFRWKVPLELVRNALFYDEVKLSPSQLDTPPIPCGFYVQPDFDIIVLPSISYSIRWTLSMFTSLLNNDLISIYKLTMESVTQSIRRGLGIAEIISFLTMNSEVELPDHIVLTLEKWDQELNHTDPNPMSSECQCWLVGLLVEDEQNKETFIKQFGNEDATRQYPYAVDDEIPQPQLLFQQYEQVPTMWVKDFRSYHISTVRQIIEQAILLKTKVKLSLDGEKVDFIPLMFSNNSNVISGERYNPTTNQYEMIELNYDDWKEMKLIIPSFT